MATTHSTAQTTTRFRVPSVRIKACGPGAFYLPEDTVFFVPVLLIALLDVGGLHVFAGVMIYDKFRHR